MTARGLRLGRLLAKMPERRTVITNENNVDKFCRRTLKKGSLVVRVALQHPTRVVNISWTYGWICSKILKQQKLRKVGLN